jgi:uncharacterized membrane protein (UPF0127 family)
MTRLITLLLVAASLSACGSPPADNPARTEDDQVSIPFRKDGTLTISRDDEVYLTLDIEIADSDSSRNRGLMQRDGLPEDSGMWFIFDQESEQGFWMANTRIALDLIFVRSDGTIQSIAKYIQPMRTETVSSDGLSQYVLEVEAGYSDSKGILEGDVIAFERDAPTDGQ